MLDPDPLLSWPLACRILAPGGLVDLAPRLPRQGGVTLEHVGPQEVQALADGAGLTFTRATEPGVTAACPPPEGGSSESTTTTATNNPDGSKSTTETRVKRTVNPDGSVTTETTEIKDGQAGPTMTTRSPELGRVGGVRLRLELEYGAEFSLIRPLTKLRVGDACQITENYTDRHVLRVWTNAVVESPPQWPFLASAGRRDFHRLSLQFLIVGGTP